MKFTVFLGALTWIAAGQTQVDLKTQSKSVDFSSAAFTKPARVGSAVPSTCGVGEVFFNTGAVAGQNLYICAATNVFVPLSGVGGGGSAGSFPTTTVGALPALCNIGDVRFAVDATVSAGGFNVYFCTAANTWAQFGYVVGGSGALASSCSSLPCTIDTTAAVPLKAGANVWSGANDFSGAAKTAPFQVGTSDPAICDATAHEFYFNTSINGLKSCNATNTWTLIARAGGGLASIFLPVGVNNSAGTVQQSDWGVDATGPALTCNGSTPSPCFLTFPNTGLPKAAYLTLVAPSTFSGLILSVEWFSNSTAGGNISLQADAQCLSSNATAAIGITPTWTGTQTAVVANNTSTASVRRQTVFTNVGTCAPGDMIRVRFQRVASGDTYADAIRLLGGSASY